MTPVQNMPAENTPEREAYYKATDAAYTMGYKIGRGSDPSTINDVCPRVATELVDASKAVCIDLNLFDPDKIMDTVKKYDKKALVLKHCSSNNRFQKDLDKKINDQDFPVRDLTLVNAEIGMYGTPRYVNMTSLTLVDSTFNGKMEEDLQGKDLVSLKVERCKVDRSFSGVIANSVLEVAGHNNLKKFTMREMSLLTGSDDKKVDWSKLPESLEYLNLSKTDVMNADFDGLMEKLPKLKNLKVFEMASCGLSDEHAQKLSKALQQSEVKHINLSGNPMSLSVNDKNVICGDYFEWSGAEINKMVTQGKTLQAQASKELNKDQLLKSGLLAAAAKSDNFEDSLKSLKAKGTYLSSQDYLAEQNDGNTIIQDLTKTRQLTSVFKPEYWLNPKEMQKVWDAVSDEGKGQLGPNGGKAAFQVRKNQVMMNAVRMATQAKSR
ncbi:MAG: hypothetical protein MJ247_01190 [Alphaproteobacteria bacterium]|nr:hypothetical protein [Alphaproteobacteria bacterium]